MEKFKSLDAEKQLKILDAALLEFAEQGYDKASTNRIVKQAGIGKGMLFYYFNSKKNLYEFLAEYSLDFVEKKYFSQIDLTETDFIERLRQTSKLKFEAQKESENVFNFLGTLMLTADFQLAPHIQKKYETMQQQGNAMIYENVDVSLFRDDIDAEKVLKLIRWSIEGYQTELLHKLQGQNTVSIDFDPYWEEFYEYLEILRKSFYKKGV